MPTGGLKQQVWVYGIVAVLLLWLICVGYEIAHGLPAETLLNTVRVFPLLTYVIAFLPREASRLWIVQAVFWISAAVWLVGSWRLGSDFDLQLFLISLGTILTVGGLLTVLDRIYNRLQAEASPARRAAIDAGLAVVLFLPFFYMIGRLIGPISLRSVFIDNWDLTLVLVYLPVMGLIAWFFYWRRLWKRKNDK